MNKQKLVEQIASKLSEELSALVQAAKAAHEAATHEESKAEDSHDTRGLEASYLAGAQAARATEIQKLISMFRQLNIHDFAPSEPIAIGAIVELELGGRRTSHLLAPSGGGISVLFEGQTVQVITPQAPLGDALLGRKAGEEVEVEAQGKVREYLVKKVI